MANPRSVSVVIPVFNEAQSVPRLYTELASVAAAPDPSTRTTASGRGLAQDSAPRALPVGLHWEFIFVDDGSRDGTWETLVALQQQDSRVRAIRLKRNFGQTAAMACGIEAARGEVIVTMDGDLQNDPADISRLLQKLDEGYDVVCGWRYQRQDKFLTRKVPSLVANRLIGWLTGVRLHDYGCSLKAYRADVIKRTPLYAEFHRFIPAMARLTGALIAEVKVNHRPRRFGRTKYNLSRTWRVTLDMFTVSLLIRFAAKPLRLFGMLALCAAAVSAACVARSWGWYISPHRDIPQVLPATAVLSVWLAGHFMIVGLIAELCLATAHTRPERLVASQETLP